jgi:hypothetical protein
VLTIQLHGQGQYQPRLSASRPIPRPPRSADEQGTAAKSVQLSVKLTHHYLANKFDVMDGFVVRVHNQRSVRNQTGQDFGK